MTGEETDIETLVPKACDWVSEQTGSSVDPSTDLLGGGVLDSLAFIGLVAFVEEITGLELDLLEVDPEEIATIDGLCRFAFQKGSSR